MATVTEEFRIGIARDVLLKLVERTSVNGVLSPDLQLQLSEAAANIAAVLISYDGYVTEEIDMAVSAVFRKQMATAKTIKNSGGDAAITLASLANGSGRQCVKLDLGATHAQLWAVKATFEIAATPTAGATIDFYWAPSSSATAGTDNPANVTGTDAAYSGYSSNLTAAIKQLVYIGSFVCTTQATTTVQSGNVGRFSPPARYGSLIVVNNSGAALHSTDTNQAITMTPEELTSEPS